LHQILILDDGRIIRCSNQCAQIRRHYEEFLREQTESEEARAFEDRLRNLEQDAITNRDALDANRRALEGSADPHQREGLEQTRAQLRAEDQRIAEDTGRLDLDIRRFASEALSSELGVPLGRLINILEVLTPEQTRQMHGRLGGRLFNFLVRQSDPQTIRLFVRAVELAGTNTVAQSDAVRILEFGRLNRRTVREPELRDLLSRLTRLTELYPGEISRIYAETRAELERNQVSGARDHLNNLEQNLYTTVGVGRTRTVAERIMEDAQAGRVREYQRYHGGTTHAMDRSTVQQILANPDAIYQSGGARGLLIYRRGNDVVFTLGPGQGEGNLVTAFGPSGLLGPSGVDAWSWARGHADLQQVLQGVVAQGLLRPSDLDQSRPLNQSQQGFPVTHDMIVNGQIPSTRVGIFNPSGVQIWP
jgi:hypothetical protein